MQKSQIKMVSMVNNFIKLADLDEMLAKNSMLACRHCHRVRKILKNAKRYVKRFKGRLPGAVSISSIFEWDQHFNDNKCLMQLRRYSGHPTIVSTVHLSFTTYHV